MHRLSSLSHGKTIVHLVFLYNNVELPIHVSLLVSVIKLEILSKVDN